MTGSSRVIRVRPLDAGRWEEVASLERQCFRRPWAPTSIRDVMDNPLCRTLGAERVESPGGLVGYAIWSHHGGISHVLDLAVDPDFRREGIGGRLLEALCAAAVSEGADTVFLEVRVGNAPARAFYRRHRFKPLGRKSAYYPDTGEDAFVLVRKV